MSGEHNYRLLYTLIPKPGSFTKDEVVEFTRRDNGLSEEEWVTMKKDSGSEEGRNTGWPDPHGCETCGCGPLEPHQEDCPERRELEDELDVTRAALEETRKKLSNAEQNLQAVSNVCGRTPGSVYEGKAYHDAVYIWVRRTQRAEDLLVQAGWTRSEKRGAVVGWKPPECNAPDRDVCLRHGTAPKCSWENLDGTQEDLLRRTEGLLNCECEGSGTCEACVLAAEIEEHLGVPDGRGGFYTREELEGDDK